MKYIKHLKPHIYGGLFVRTFFLQALWNFERLQNVGFLYILYPFLKKLYPDKEKRKEVLLRHIGFFNTNPYMASIIIPMVLNCERLIAEGKNIPVNKPVMLKSLMAGPVAAIGDSFFWGTLRPFCVFVSIFLFMLSINVFSDISYFCLVPIVFICLYNIIHLTFRYWMMVISFKLHEKMIPLISKLEIKLLGDALRLIGVLTVVASIVLYFKTFGFIVSVQGFSVLGQDMPEIFFFSIILILGFLLGKIKPSVMFYCIMILCFILGYMEL